MDTHQWIEVDYLSDTKVTGVATQGRGNNLHQWVTRYHIMYKSAGGDEFEFVEDPDQNAVV